MPETPKSIQAVESWSETLQEMRLGIEETLAQNQSPAFAPAIKHEPTLSGLLERLAKRLQALENCMHRMEEEIQEAEIAAHPDIASLQEWTGKMAQTGEALAKAATRAI